MILLALWAHQWVRPADSLTELTLQCLSPLHHQTLPTYSVAPEEPNITACSEMKGLIIRFANYQVLFFSFYLATLIN